jgi:hypothetical protein
MTSRIRSLLEWHGNRRRQDDAGLHRPGGETFREEEELLEARLFAAVALEVTGMAKAWQYKTVTLTHGTMG